MGQSQKTVTYVANIQRLLALLVGYTGEILSQGKEMEHLMMFCCSLVVQQKKSLTQCSGQIADLRETLFARNKTKDWLCNKAR